MKTFFLWAPVAAAVLVGLGGCAPRVAAPLTLAAPVQSAPQTVRLGEGDQGNEVLLKVDDTLEITLPANPSVGYAWQPTGDSQPTLQPLGQPDFQPGDAGPEVGGLMTLRYRAARPGEVQLILTYLNPSSPPSPATRDFGVTVTVQ